MSYAREARDALWRLADPLNRLPIRVRLAAVSTALTFVILCSFATIVGDLTVRRIRSDFERDVLSVGHRGLLGAAQRGEQKSAGLSASSILSPGTQIGMISLDGRTVIRETPGGFRPRSLRSSTPAVAPSRRRPSAGTWWRTAPCRTRSTANSTTCSTRVRSRRSTRRSTACACCSSSACSRARASLCSAG